MLFKRYIRQAFSRMGYDIRRIGRSEPGLARPDMWTWLRHSRNIKTVIDIGANNGEFAEFLSTYFGADKTFAIEPLPSCAELIMARAANIKNLELFSCALSDQEGRAVLHENNYGPASSLLPVSSISASEFPQTANSIAEVEVPVARLDDLLDCRSFVGDVMIKIDVQGLEDKVIRGGEKVFKNTSCIMVEMSFVPMYEGQPLFEEVHCILFEMGFRLSGIKNQIDSEITGQPLFMHCLYIKQ